MDITVNHYKRCAVIKIKGRIDSSSAPEVRKVLTDITEAGIYNLVLDMSEVNFLASSGLWALIDTQKTCTDAKNLKRGELVLANPDKSIVRSFELVGMHQYFKIFDDVTTAVGSF